MGEEERSNKNSPKVLYARTLYLPVRLVDGYPHRQTLREDDEYAVTKYEVLNRVAVCEVCGREEQAQHRVTIRNITSGREMLSGLDCLQMDFGRTRAQIRAAVKGSLQLARQWLDFNGNEAQSFVDTEDAIQDLLRRLPDSLSFEAPANVEALRWLEQIAADLGGRSAGGYDRQLALLRFLLRLHREHRTNKPRFVDRGVALADHPLLSPRERRVASAAFLEPENLSWQALDTLEQTLRSLRRRDSYPTRIQEVSPWEFQSEADYRQALSHTMLGEANHLPRTGEEIGIRAAEDVITNTVTASSKVRIGLVRIIVAGASEAEVTRFQPRQKLVDLVERRGWHMIVGKRVRKYEVDRDVELARRQAPIHAEEDESDGNQGRRNVVEGYRKAIVVYHPDRWFQAYAVWARYGGITARDLLERL